MSADNHTPSRTIASIGLVLTLVAVVAAVLAYRSSTGDAATAGCGPLPAAPGSTVNGVTAVLADLPGTITPTHVVEATMLLSADPAPSSIESTDSAYLLLVDEQENVVGSGNFAFNAIAPSHRVVDGSGLSMRVGGEAFVCADLDDPSANTTRPLAPGAYRAAAVLDTEAGYLVTPLRAIRVE